MLFRRNKAENVLTTHIKLALYSFVVGLEILIVILWIRSVHGTFEVLLRILSFLVELVGL